MKRISVFFFVFLLATSIFSFLVRTSVGEEHVYGIASSVDLAKPVSEAYEYNMSGKYVNMVRNPGFEEGLEGWDKRQSWRPDLDMWSNITVDSTVSHSGKNSVRIEQHNFGYGYVRQIFYVGNQTVKYFRASAWARSDKATFEKQWFDLLVFVVYEDGKEERFDEQFSHGTHDWEYKSLLVSANETKRLNHVRVYVRFQEEGGVAWFDDVSFVWVDTDAQVRCVDKESESLANAEVEVYAGSELLSAKYTDENGTASFLLAANVTHSFLVYWSGMVVGSKDVRLFQATDLLILCDVSFETGKVTMALHDIFGQPLSGSVVEVYFRSLTSRQDLLVGQFATDSRGEVQFSVLLGSAELTVLLDHNGEVYESSKLISVEPETEIKIEVGLVKLAGQVLPVGQFVLYCILGFFLASIIATLLYDMYRWKRTAKVPIVKSERMK